MAGQLCFLSEELVGLALFDDELDNETKDKMILTMKEKETKDPLKRATIDLELIHHMTLVDLTGKNSMILFKNMHLPDNYLEFPADQWKHQSSFYDAKSFISSMAITNDHAERGIALIESFSGQFTKDEEQFQFTSQVVADHCKSFLNFQNRPCSTILNRANRQHSI